MTTASVHVKRLHVTTLVTMQMETATVIYVKTVIHPDQNPCKEIMVLR